MAIKIKHKAKKKHEASVSDSEEVELEQEEDLPLEPDGFQQAAVESAAWVSSNRTTFVIGSLVIVALVVAAFVLFHTLESRKVEISDQLNPVFEATSRLIKGTPDYETVEQSQPGFDIRTFASRDEQQNAILATSQQVVEKTAGEPIEVAARLAEGAALMNLNKPDEALANYQVVVERSVDPYLTAMAHYGIAQAYAAKGSFNEAVDSLNSVEKDDPAVVKGLRYTKAKWLEAAGKTDEAKTLYHQILDENAAGTYKSDIERRLATL